MEPHNPSSIQFANFLAHLSSNLSLSASSVKVHRAAISTTLKQIGGPSFSEDPLLGNIVQAAALREARNPKRVPSWDLFLVLAALRLPPFEPIRETPLKFLTLKTAFLVSLALGRRSSEVHALSGLPKDIAYEPDGSISLRFLPEFLAKNQAPGDPSPILLIKPLSSILGPDDEDRFLCPVRALRLYRKRTNASRAQRRRLFLSWNVNYPQDIRRSTLARWIAEVISSAYAKSDAGLPAITPKPHEVRAWAASLAFSHSNNLQAVLDAAYWRNPGTFIHFYLRDVSRLREDGSRGISSAVVAQQTLSRPGTSTRH